MRLTERDSKDYHALLNEVEFGRFFMRLVQLQYLLLQGFIKTRTEKLHVL
jgi:hypothetical protein